MNVFYNEKKEKSEIASLCKTLSELAKDGDELSRWVFKEAGKELAKFIQSLYPGASKVRFCFKIITKHKYYIILVQMFKYNA